MFTLMLMVENLGERDKLEELYNTYCKELFYVSYKILHDYHDAQDVLQNAFVKVFKHLDKIGEIRCKKTRGYLVIIVRNLSYDRYNEKRRTVPVEFMDDMEEKMATDVSLEKYVLNLERGKELAIALSKINSGYADILTLKYYYEYNNTEIGELFHLSTDIVSVRLNRARAALKKVLSKGGEYQ